MSIRISDRFSYKTLLKFTLPSIAMMIFTSIYGVVDGLFVSNLAGDIPFKAVNFIMPFLMIPGSVGFMFGTGGTAIVSNTFGKGDSEKANELFSLFVYVTFVLGVVLAAVCIAFIRPIALLLGAEGELLENSVVYGRIVLCALPFLVLQYLFQSFFVAAEKPRLGLFVIIAAGVTNMILDALLVSLLPQEYKLAGAALATAFSQLVGGGVPLLYFFRKNSSILRLRLKLKGVKVYFKEIIKACTNGSSEFMSNVSMSVVGMLYNYQLLQYAGDDGISAYGVMMYVSMIFSAAFIGYSIGTAPVIGYNNGAENKAEVKSLLKKSLILIGVCGIAMTALAEISAYPLSLIFVSYSEKLMDMTVRGFRIFSFSFLFMGISIFSSSFFTALNDGLTSALISFLRTLVFQVAAVVFLPMAFNLDGIWLSVVVAEVAAFALSFLFLVVKRKKYGY